MSERFFCDQPIAGDEATLTDAEAHHLLHVMRLKAGARVTLFDGSGAEFDAEVRRCGRRDVELAVLARTEVNRERPAPLVVAAALPKGDRQRWLVEKLTELGVTRLVPLETERSVAKLTKSGADKLRRAVVEASKQCRRNRLMEIVDAAAFDQLVGDVSATVGRRLLAHPVEDAAAVPTSDAAATLLVGPEGGFSDAEFALAKEAGWAPLSLGPRILRTETAAIAAVLSAAGA